MSPQSFALDILVHGYPGKTVCHGGLGWSTIALVRVANHIVLVDGGAFGVRKLLLDKLKEHGIGANDVTDVVLTHAHYDHAVNWTLFPKAQVSIGAAELGWALQVPPGPSPVPELYVRELDRAPNVRRLKAGDEVVPGMIAHDAPGHTPGHLIFVLSGPDKDVIFTGDAAKNRAEFLSRDGFNTMDVKTARETFDKIWTMWKARPGNLIVPGHDLPMVLENGKPVYVGKRVAAIEGWHGDSLDRTTTFSLCSE